MYNTWHPRDGRTIYHVGQYSATNYPILRELSQSGSNYWTTKFNEGWDSFEGSTNTHPTYSPHSSSLVSLPRWRSVLVLNTLMYLFIWEISWRGSEILDVMRKRTNMDVIEGWCLILCLDNYTITSRLWSRDHIIVAVLYTAEEHNPPLPEYGPIQFVKNTPQLVG